MRVRTVDALRVAMDVVLLVTTAVLSQIADDIDQAFSGTLSRPPGLPQDLLADRLLGSRRLVARAARHHGAAHRVKLTLEALGGVVLAVGIGVVAAAIVTGHVSEVLRALFDSNGPPVFPPLAPAITAAVITVMAPYLTVPARRAERNTRLPRCNSVPDSGVLFNRERCGSGVVGHEVEQLPVHAARKTRELAAAVAPHAGP